MKFRKKPVEVEAMHLTTANASEIAAWCGGRFVNDTKPSDPDDVALSVFIPTLEGTMRADVGDWIIKGTKGEFYPCKPDIFVDIYEPA